MTKDNIILTITGSDSTAGSGIQADITTITALGGRAVSAITSITVQTSLGIQEFYDVPADIVEGQIEAAMNDAEPQTVKIGMIRSLDTLDVIIRVLQRYKPRNIIFDQITTSALGDTLVPTNVAKATERFLLPLCTLVLRREDSTFHGQANHYASAVAVFMAQGFSADEAQQKAREYINTQVARSATDQSRSAELYNHFIDLVEANYRHNSDVHYYARRMNVSPRYLAQVTKRISGKAPKTIIDDLILQQALLLLTTTTKTIQQIAYETGFSSQAHFSKFFKKLKNITPSKFRKQ